MTLRRAVALLLPALVIACGDDAPFEPPSTVDSSTSTASSASAGGQGGAGGAQGGGGMGAGGDPWEPVRTALEESDIADMALVVGDASGVRFVHLKGTVTLDTPYSIGSAAKWLSSGAFLRLVEEGAFNLDDHPHDYVGWWTDEASDPRSQVTFRQLLSFTSGYSGAPVGPQSPPCISDGGTTINLCGQAIYDDPSLFPYPPATTYYYGPSHMQMAAAVVEAITTQSWAQVFDARIASPLGMTSTAYETPSASNPRVAGGVTSTADDYASFLAAMLSASRDESGNLWPTTFDDMVIDMTPADSVTIAAKPIEDYDWHYGLGVWRECQTPTWGPSCDPPGIISSTGAFGWHPWLDIPRGYWGLLAMQLPIFSQPAPSQQSIDLSLVLKPLVVKALTASD